MPPAGRPSSRTWPGRWTGSSTGSAVLRHGKRLNEEISHERRTPVARILAETGFLSGQPVEDEGVRAALETISSSAQELREILEVLMTDARTSNGAPPGRCDVEAVVQRLVASRTSGDIVIGVHTSGSAVAGVDSAVLERALSPILDNALRFATSRVDLTTTAGRNNVSIDVLDDGPGIPEEDLALIFEPGRRGSAPDPHEGAGLGPEPKARDRCRRIRRGSWLRPRSARGRRPAFRLSLRARS